MDPDLVTAAWLLGGGLGGLLAVGLFFGFRMRAVTRHHVALRKRQVRMSSVLSAGARTDPTLDVAHVKLHTSPLEQSSKVVTDLRAIASIARGFQSATLTGGRLVVTRSDGGRMDFGRAKSRGNPVEILRRLDRGARATLTAALKHGVVVEAGSAHRVFPPTCDDALALRTMTHVAAVAAVFGREPSNALVFDPQETWELRQHAIEHMELSSSEVQELVGDPEPRIRLAALQWLQDDEALVDLASEDGLDAGIRLDALEAATVTETFVPTLEEALISLLEGPDARRAAVQLGLGGTVRAVPALRELAGNPAWDAVSKTAQAARTAVRCIQSGVEDAAAGGVSLADGRTQEGAVSIAGAAGRARGRVGEG
jgi:hypothetical protein